MSCWVLTELRRPSNHLSNELLSCRLLAVECAQESKELSLIRGIWNELGLCVDGDEEDGQVTRRVKYVRSSFLQTVEQSQSHWLERPIIPNQLCRPIGDLYLPQLPKEEPHDR